MSDRPSQRPLHELWAIVARDAARFAELAEAWDNMTEREQVALLKYAQSRVAKT